jgi:hypothetical protein
VADRDARSIASNARRRISWRAVPCAAVIVTIGGEVSALAAKAATAITPIVVIVATDPIAKALAENALSRSEPLTQITEFYPRILCDYHPLQSRQAGRKQ